jgi:hypothetical protein
MVTGKAKQVKQAKPSSTVPSRQAFEWKEQFLGMAQGNYLVLQSLKKCI